MVGPAAGMLLGRETDLAVLASAVDTAAAGDALAVLVTGEAGVGKTVLLGAFRDSLPSTALHLASQCVDLGDPGLRGQQKQRGPHAARRGGR